MDLVLASGSWPGDIAGELYFSAPEVVEGVPLALFGPGRLCRLSLVPGSFGAPADRWAWRTSVIDSPSARLFEAAPERFTAGPTGFSSPFGVPNQANTAPLPWGERLFATWDAGRPVEVDPATLGFLGEVGHRDSWGEPATDLGGVLPFFLSSAHPVVDPERDCLWTVKLSIDLASGTQGIEVVHWDGAGTLVEAWPVEGATVLGGAHCIAQTRDFLLLVDSGNFIPDPAEMVGAPRSVTIGHHTPVHILRKDAILSAAPGSPLRPVTSRVSPTTGHLYACWDDGDGIRVLFEHMDLVDLGYRIEADDLDALGRAVDPLLAGFYNMAMAPNTVTEVLLEPERATATEMARLCEDWMFNLQLSAMDWSIEGLSAPTVHHVAIQGYRPDAVSRRALGAYSDRVGALPGADTPGVLATLERGSLEVRSSHTYASTADHITSPVFVPRRPGTDPGGHDGYVVVPVLSDSGMRVEVFDAARVGDGPLATLATPGSECVPLLLHSAWAPVAGSVDHSIERLAFADELGDRIDTLAPELGAEVRKVAADLADSARG